MAEKKIRSLKSQDLATRKLKDDRKILPVSKQKEKKDKSVQPQPMRETPQALPKPKKIDFVDTCELPYGYNTTSLTLMPRDPNWIYAYWEINHDSIMSMRDRIGSEMDRSKYVLRMYDVTAIDFNGFNANSWFDFEVGNANNWYVNLWKDSVSYCGEIGLKSPNGNFYALARSNFVNTPRSNQSWRNDVIWMEVKDAGASQPFIEVDYPKHRNSSQASNYQKKRRIYLTDDDIRAYYIKLFPLLRLVISARKDDWEEEMDLEVLEEYIKNKKSIDDAFIKTISRVRSVRDLILGASENLAPKEGFKKNILDKVILKKKIKKTSLKK